METLIVYHRAGGKSLGYPPNSIIAIRWALKNNAKAIEYDVVVSKNKKNLKMVVIEPKLIKEQNLDIDNLNWEDLSRINAGNEKYGQCKVVTLKEVLKLVNQTKVKQQIHIKGNNSKTIQALISELSDYNNILITSFDLRVLENVKTSEPELKVGWIVKQDSKSGSEGTVDLTKMVTSNPDSLPDYTNKELSDIMDKAKSSNINTVILCAPRIKKRETITFFQKEGFEVGAWGIGSNISIAKRLIDFGINRFTIDNPEQLK